jgi:hypothetical protein
VGKVVVVVVGGFNSDSAVFSVITVPNLAMIVTDHFILNTGAICKALFSFSTKSYKTA